MNAEAIRFSRYLANDRPVQDDWKSVLPIAQRIVNAQTSASLGLSPADRFLPGRDINAQLLPDKLVEPVKVYLRNEMADRKRRDAVQEYLDNLTTEAAN